ncbi:MAG: hypothetical protein Q4C70_11990, partial [Planctomycetia bacterium]|nr:hypothetical protein [Planctomycetia bacterium]
MKKFKVIFALVMLYVCLLCVESPRIARLFVDCGLQATANAEVTEPARRDEYITTIATALLQKEHISERSLDAQLSERTLTVFLKMLDPQKLYFYQSDIDAIRQLEPQLGDLFRKGNIKLAYVVFKTYLNRLDERVRMMQEELEKPINFTIDENMITDPEKLTYSKTPTEAQERVRLRVKYDMLILQVDDLKKEQKKAAEAKSEAEKGENAT